MRQSGYAVTTGVANTYVVTLSPAPSAYVDGMGITVRIHATSTGTLTFNVNGLGAKAGVDSKGNAFTATKPLLAGGRYTFRYSAVAGNFQLQGEGASGNAIASDLLSGKTASVDAGDIIGTLVPGMLNYASGNVFPSGAVEAFTSATNSTYGLYSVTVNGLIFTPKIVLVYSELYPNPYWTVACSLFQFIYGATSGGRGNVAVNSSGFQFDANCYLSAGGFKLPVINANGAGHLHKWHAWG